MVHATVAETALKNGEPTQALALLQDDIRARPADPKLRVFLFQLLSVLGQWERALNQLNVAAELDPAALAMAQTYREAIACELLRERVFAGLTSPMVFGMPEQWLALLIESMLLAGRGRMDEAAEFRRQAFERAAPASGEIDGTPFEWIADADSRIGPVLEAIINGKYYWVPFTQLSRIDLEAPADLRDFVWMPAHLQFANGGESVALIPARYAGSANSGDGLIQLSRKTEWQALAGGEYLGMGQRILATDTQELPLLDVRDIRLHPTDSRPDA